MTKRKSEKRFEQLLKIREVIIPSLPSGRGINRAASAAVLYSCWAQARGADCKFDATNQQIADGAGIDRRSVIRIMGELERAGIVKTIKRGSGHRGSIRVITGRPFERDAH